MTHPNQSENPVLSFPPITGSHCVQTPAGPDRSVQRPHVPHVSGMSDTDARHPVCRLIVPSRYTSQLTLCDIRNIRQDLSSKWYTNSIGVCRDRKSTRLNSSHT